MYYAANEILEKIYNRGAKNDMSFAGWKNRAQQTRAALLELRKELDAELDGMADTWAKKVIDDKRESYAASFADVTAEAQRHILADLEEVAAAKQARFSEAMGDPGAAAVNVLSLLNMRTELSPGDIAAAVPHLSGSLIALQTLREIAKRHNISFPSFPDAEAFANDLAEVRSFAEEKVRELTTPADNMAYWQRLFWDSDAWGLPQPKVDALDNPRYLKIDVDEIGAEEQADDEPSV